MIQFRFLDSVAEIRGRKFSAYQLVVYVVVFLSLIVFGFPIYWCSC